MHNFLQFVVIIIFIRECTEKQLACQGKFGWCCMMVVHAAELTMCPDAFFSALVERPGGASMAPS